VVERFAAVGDVVSLWRRGGRGMDTRTILARRLGANPGPSD